MKKLLLLAVSLMIMSAYAAPPIKIAEPKIELQDENGDKIEGVTMSNRPSKIIQKASQQGNGTYFGEYKGKVKIIINMPDVIIEPEPVACPASHPVRIPTVTFTVHYDVNTSDGTKNWRLASDKTGEDSGYSIHGDWVNGWKPSVSKTWTDHCLKASKDCHADLLGDGRQLLEP